jgi:hypothetical protein
MNQDSPQPPAPRFRPVPWIELQTPQDAEAWIDEHNRSMVEHIGPQETGVGVCFCLAVGGMLYLQTTGDAVLVDVDEDAAWISPLIAAATGVEPPRGRLWILPDDKLVQLLIGLSSLVETTTLVTGHKFGARYRTQGSSR